MRISINFYEFYEKFYEFLKNLSPTATNCRVQVQLSEAQSVTGQSQRSVFGASVSQVVAAQVQGSQRGLRNAAVATVSSYCGPNGPNPLIC